MNQKTVSLLLCAAGLSVPAAFGFSTDPSSLVRTFGATSATTNAPIVVTATFNNGGAAALRGFYYAEQIPSGLTVTMLGLKLNGVSVANYTFESGLDGDVYAGCTPYRWVLELPPGFTQNNPVPANATVQIQYAITSPSVGAFNLQQFNWAGFNPASTNAAFGYSESSDAQSVSFTAGQPPSYPILTTTASGMNFSASPGANPASQTLGIANSGGGTLNWTAAADGSAPAWLTVSPAGGTGNGTLTVTVTSTNLAAGNYNKSLTVTAAGASNSPQTVVVSLTVNPAGGTGTNHYDFTYASRAALLAGGWDFLARTAAGATRNTEQTNGAVVSYDQTAHPGVLRVPADAGDIWANMNNTRNSVFRNLPTNCTSIRLKLSFNPTQNYQQSGIALYQDDDNYVFVDRVFNGGNLMACSYESAGNPNVLPTVSVTATNNMLLRLDRNPTNGVISAYYSLNGTTWVSFGNPGITLTNPRLGIFAGSSPGGLPNADYAWVEVLVPSSSPGSPALGVSPANLSFSTPQGGNPPGQTLGISNSGGGTLNWTVAADTNAPAWLAASPASGTGNGIINVSAASASLAPGTYNKNLTITALGAAGSPQVVAVALTVTAAPTSPSLAVSPAALNFNASQGSNPANQPLGITNLGGGTMSWTATADTTAPAWLTVSPASGTGNGGATVAVASASLAPGTYSKNLTVTAPGATNSPRTVSVTLTVAGNTSGNGTNHYDFTYTNRASLLADGWDFLARTAAGANRNTEQTNGAVVSYAQAGHPGTLRVPADAGDIWANMNNTRNSVFRNLPTNYTSIQLKLAFNPTQNYQQSGIAVYQDDDNYIYVDRIYNGGNLMASSYESAGNANVLSTAGATATTNMVLRLDRNSTNGVITAYYSLNGTTWTSLGSRTMTLTNPRLGIFTGSSPGGLPNADYAWVEVIAPQSGSAMVVTGGMPAANPVGQSTAPPGGKIESLATTPDGQIQFTLNGLAGQSFMVQASTNLSNWDDLGTVTLEGEMAEFVDGDASNHPFRYYRTKLVTPVTTP